MGQVCQVVGDKNGVVGVREVVGVAHGEAHLDDPQDRVWLRVPIDDDDHEVQNDELILVRCCCYCSCAHGDGASDSEGAYHARVQPLRIGSLRLRWFRSTWHRDHSRSC